MKSFATLRLVATALAASRKAPDPGPVPQEAIDYLAEKRLRPGFSYKDVWKQEHVTAFTVAKIMEVDILKTVQKSLVRSLEQGKPFREWAKEIRPELTKSGWLGASNRSVPSRLYTIYDTNTRVARSVGQWQRIQRTKRALPYLIYQLGPSEKHREEHAAWEGTIKRVDDEWWDTHMTPNGYRCRCHVRQISAGEAEDLGGETDTPPQEYEEHIHPKTGDVDLTPKGVQPGFDFNPGKSRSFILNNALQEAEVKPKAEAPGPDATYKNAAQMFRDLILKGDKSDADIFKAVQKQFGLDDEKKSYVAWYRNDLKKKGLLEGAPAKAEPNPTKPKPTTEKPPKATKTEPLPVPAPVEAQPVPTPAPQPAPAPVPAEPTTSTPHPVKLREPPTWADYHGDAASPVKGGAAPTAQELGRALSVALNDGTAENQAAGRKALNQLLHANGMVSQDLVDRFTRFEQAQLKIADIELARGVHTWEGGITVSSRYADDFKRAADKASRGEKLSGDEMSDVKTLVHEAIHGHSPMEPAIYQKRAGRALEEATVEMAAAHVVAKTFDTTYDDLTKSYKSHREGLARAVAAAAGVSEADATSHTVKAAVEMRSLSFMVTSLEGYYTHFVSHLDNAAGEAVRAELKATLKPGQENDALAVDTAYSAIGRKHPLVQQIIQAMEKTHDY